MSERVIVRRALLSVSDKTGLVELARALAACGAELISTGGTAKAIAEAGLKVTPIETVTGFPEIMDGRVKTLHPAVHGGLLAVRDNAEHQAAMVKHAIRGIDLVCVNLYPFEQTVARAGVTFEEAIENIDIGGPSMIRSAAKNHAWVAVVTDPAQYAEVIAELQSTGGATSGGLRARLAASAFARTAAYDGAITEYLSRAGKPESGGEPIATGLPRRLNLSLSLKQPMRYGENPHQAGGLYVTGEREKAGGSIASAKQLHGKELSYNNVNDAAAALELVRALTHLPAAQDAVAACVVKHMNPCGAALAGSVLEAVNEAIAGDPVAAYGGILAVSRAIDDDTAARLGARDIFMEVVVAPAFHAAAAERLKVRWANLRMLEVGEIGPAAAGELEIRSIPGNGYLVQERDVRLATPAEITHVGGPPPTDVQLAAAAFLEAVGRSLLSNAVCLGGVSPGGRAIRLFGAGAGQMDRLNSCRIAVAKAGERAAGAVAYSDAFFPFSDGPQVLIEGGVSCLVQPGGSKRDQDTFDLCKLKGVTCLVTGLRHFRH